MIGVTVGLLLLAVIVVGAVLASQEHLYTTPPFEARRHRHQQAVKAILARANVLGSEIERLHQQVEAAAAATGPTRTEGKFAVVSGHPMALELAGLPRVPAPVPVLSPHLVHSVSCNGPKNPNVTRHDMWSKCFVPLVDRHPRDGFMTVREVQIFMDTFLRTYEKWLAPSAAAIGKACDHPFNGKKPNGRVNWPIFETATDPMCLGVASDICYAKGACDRELAKLGLPLTSVIYE